MNKRICLLAAMLAIVALLLAVVVQLIQPPARPPAAVLPTQFVPGNVLPSAVPSANADSPDRAASQPVIESASFNTPKEPPSPASPAALGTSDAAVNQAVPDQPVPHQIVITFNPGTSPEQQQAYLQTIGAAVVQRVDALNAVVASVSPAVAAQPLPESPTVAVNEPDYYAVALGGEANDPLYPQQWSLPVIGAPEGWAALPADAPTAAIAVIDSGICADHPDLQGRILPGHDFVDHDTVPQDDFGHGCGVAGIIAANLNNTEGIAGIAPNARILPVRVLNAQGIGSYSDVAAGIVYAADHGATIINLSLGGAHPSTVLQNAIDYAISRNITVIAAAGNTGGAVLYPAAYAPVIAVASVDSNLQHSSFSSHGPEVDILAPGRDILTTSRDGGYGLMTGTSFAAPQVAGVAALEMALGRGMVIDGQIVQIFLGETPDKPGTPEPADPSQAYVLIEGDIRIPAVQHEMWAQAAYEVQLWPDGIVPYEFESSLSPESRNAMIAAMAEWEAVANIDFVERTGQSDYVFIKADEGNWSSSVGKSILGGHQQIAIHDWNDKFIMAHELGHALGFWHEQSRPDRDSYIEILTQNIQPTVDIEIAFGKQPSASVWGAYDFDSVMHYDQYAFSVCGPFGASPGVPLCGLVPLQTIRVKPGYESWQDRIGQRDHLSDMDKAGMAHLYPVCTASVPPGDTAALIAALAEANREDHACQTTIINLAASSQYVVNTVHNSHGPSGSANGLPLISRSIIINGSNATLQRDSDVPSFRFFELTNSGSLTLNEVQLAGGRSTTSGGAINSVYGVLTIQNSTFTNNYADNSGGALANHGSLGTGVRDKGVLTITGSRFMDNYSATTGGAIYNSDAILNISDSIFDRNGAPQGGGVSNRRSEASITNSHLLENTGTTGSAFYNQNWLGDGGPLVIQNNCIVGNAGISVVTDDALVTINAADNWWGMTSGPGGAGSGTGDSIGSGVTYLPFLTTAPGGCGGLLVGSISGTVTAQENGVPVANARVVARHTYDLQWWEKMTCTASDGTYLIANAPYDRDIIITVEADHGCAGTHQAYVYTVRTERVRLSETTPSRTDVNVSLPPGGTIRGTITNLVGRPISAHINVQAYDNSWRSGMCSPDGYYEIYGVPLNKEIIIQPLTADSCGSGNGVFSEWRFVTLTPGQRTATVDFALEEYGTISGRVTSSADGAPLAGIRVSGAVTDTDGYYEIMNLPTDEALIIAASDNSGQYITEYWDDVDRYEAAAPIILSNPDPHRLNVNFTLDRRSISGQVRDARTGLPLAGVSITVNDQPQLTATTDADGRYVLNQLPRDTALVICTAPGGYLATCWQGATNPEAATPITITTDNAAITGIDFALWDTSGVIEGTVFESDGVTPVSGMAVSLYADDGTWGWSGCTDGSGRYRVRDVPPGKDITVAADSANAESTCGELRSYLNQYYDNASTLAEADRLRLSMGEIRTNINFRLQAEGSISGTVYDETGAAPIANAFVVGYETGQYLYNRGLCTDEQGRFTLDQVPLDMDIVVLVSSDNTACGGSDRFITEYWQESAVWSGHTPIRLSAALRHTTGINFTVARAGAVSGVVTDAATGQPVGGVAVWYEGATSFLCTQEDGSYSLGGIPVNTPVRVAAGGYACSTTSYSVRWYNNTEYHLATPITITPAQLLVENINFALEAAPPDESVIAGTVYNETGTTPLTGIHVRLESLDYSYTVESCTDQEGTYRFEGVPRGVSLYVYAFGSGICGNEGYGLEYWQEAPDEAAATAIELTSDNPTHADINFTLPGQVLAAPTLLSPQNGAVLGTNPPMLQWTPVNGAAHYELQLGRNNPFTAPIQTVNGTSYVPSWRLLSTIYYWRVRAIGSTTSEWSEIFSFTTTAAAGAPPVRNLYETSELTLRWGNITWAQAYEVEWDTSAAFRPANPTYHHRVIRPAVPELPIDALSNGLYYWRVRVQRADGTWSGWSSVESFMVDIP